MMKNAMLCLMSLTTFLLGGEIIPQMSEPGKIIREDDYSKSGKNLFVKKSFKSIEGSLMIEDHDPKAHSANSHTKFPHKNYIVAFDLFLENEKSSFGFWLGGGHGLGLQFTADKLMIKNGKIKRESHVLPTGQWIPVMIERIGHELVLQINSSKSVYYTSGDKLDGALDAIGIKCFEGTYKLDNVKVWEASQKSDWDKIKRKMKL